MTKPDRYERMARQHAELCIDSMERLNATVCAKLLRREHAWMVRMVQRASNLEACKFDSFESLCGEILKQLKKRKH